MSPLFEEQAAWQEYRRILESWLGTPYKHCTMVKGRGADCTLFIAACWKEFGILDQVKYDYYSHDWHLHTYEEKILDGLYTHFCNYLNPEYRIVQLDPDVPLLQGDTISFALTPTKVSNHASVYMGDTGRGKLMLHSVRSKGVSLFPLAGYFEKHKSNVFRIMRKN